MDQENEFTNPQRVKRSTLEAVITRADGTVEDLGVIADSHWTFPFRRAAKQLRARVSRLF